MLGLMWEESFEAKDQDWRVLWALFISTDHLYQIERDPRKIQAGPVLREAIRQYQARPIFKTNPAHILKSGTFLVAPRKAARKHWLYSLIFGVSWALPSDGRIEIDNNNVEKMRSVQRQSESSVIGCSSSFNFAANEPSHFYTMIQGMPTRTWNKSLNLSDRSFESLAQQQPIRTVHTQSGSHWFQPNITPQTGALHLRTNLSPHDPAQRGWPWSGSATPGSIRCIFLLGCTIHLVPDCSLGPKWLPVKIIVTLQFSISVFAFAIAGVWYLGIQSRVVNNFLGPRLYAWPVCFEKQKLIVKSTLLWDVCC